jgi:hypothetical protein
MAARHGRVTSRPVTDSWLPAQVVHLALDLLFCQRLASIGIQAFAATPILQPAIGKMGQKKPAPVKNQIMTRKGVNRKVDRKVRPETRLRPEPLHCAARRSSSSAGSLLVGL